MNTPSKEELEADMERRRQEAIERGKHSNSFAPIAALIISMSLAFWGTMNFVVLYAFSEWRKMILISSTVIGALVIICVIALRMNKNKGKPFSPYSIFTVLLLAIAAVLAFLVNV